MAAFLELNGIPLICKTHAQQFDCVQVINIIQEGGQACVYKGRIGSEGKEVALKIFRHSDQAEREARALEVLGSARIPKLYGHFRHQDYVGLVLEYCAGLNFRDVVTLDRPVAFFKSIAQQLLEILAHMHSRTIYHNDIAPDNILWSDYGGCTLIDFGAASFGPLTSLLPFGRPSYLAPEILFGHRTTPQSDLYSLGATLFEAITQETYCADAMEKSFSVLKSELYAQDGSFFSLIKALLAPTPRLRPRSARSILDSFCWGECYDPLLVPPNESIKKPEEDLASLTGHSFPFTPTGSHCD